MSPASLPIPVNSFYFAVFGCLKVATFITHCRSGLYRISKNSKLKYLKWRKVQGKCEQSWQKNGRYDVLNVDEVRMQTMVIRMMLKHGGDENEITHH